MNSDDATCPHLRILGATLMSSWRMEQLLSRVEQGESLDTRITAIQLREARDELQLVMRDIEGIQKLCELESDDSKASSELLSANCNSFSSTRRCS
jgi:hypothetical protein